MSLIDDGLCIICSHTWVGLYGRFAGQVIVIVQPDDLFHAKYKRFKRAFLLSLMVFFPPWRNVVYYTLISNSFELGVAFLFISLSIFVWTSAANDFFAPQKDPLSLVSDSIPISHL